HFAAWLGIERIELTHRSFHEEIDDLLGLAAGARRSRQSLCHWAEERCGRDAEAGLGHAGDKLPAGGCGCGMKGSQLEHSAGSKVVAGKPSPGPPLADHPLPMGEGLLNEQKLARVEQ